VCWIATEALYPKLFKELKYVTRKLGYGGSIEVRALPSYGSIASVVTVGEGKSALVFDPTVFGKLTTVELRAVLAHEVAHLKLSHPVYGHVLGALLLRKPREYLANLAKGRIAFQGSEMRRHFNNLDSAAMGHLKEFLMGNIIRTNELSADRAAVIVTGSGKSVASFFARDRFGNRQLVDVDELARQVKSAGKNGVSSVDKGIRLLKLLQTGGDTPTLRFSTARI